VFKPIFNIVAIFTLLFSSATFSQQNQDQEPGKNLAILVLSCDKYSVLWDPFATLLMKYWPELDTKYPDLNIYLTSSQKHFDHNRIQNIQIEDDNNWSDSVRYALDQIEEDYILILLEDYLVHLPVVDQSFWDAFQVMQNSDAGYLQVSYQLLGAEPNIVYPHNIRKKMIDAEFRTSLQAAIWEKETLYEILLSGESPWGFEIAGSVRSQNSKKIFLGIEKDFPIEYLNAVDKGYIDDRVITHLKNKEGIDLVASPESGLRDKNSFLYKIKFYKKHFKIAGWVISVLLIAGYFGRRRITANSQLA